MRYIVHYYWMGGDAHSFSGAMQPEQVPAVIAELLRNHPDARIEIEPVVVDVLLAFAECIQSLDIQP